MITTHADGEILEIVIENPPVNALSTNVRAALEQAIADAEADAAIKAIILRGAGKYFCGGADITEFNDPIDHSLPRILDAIEASSKPVIAVIQGLALGGGLELALACHYRIATPGTRIGLPEVTLGILPGAGGTQRLPRLIGIEAALEMIVSGSPITGMQALKAGLIDRVAEEPCLRNEALAFARSLPAPRPVRALRVIANPSTFAKFEKDNARLLEDRDAPRACIEAVRASTNGTFEEGLALEKRLFNTLVAGDQSKALRHAFFAERAASRIDDLPDHVTRRPIRRVGIVGAGTTGGGIAMNFLSANIEVRIAEMAMPALDRGVAIIRRNYDGTAKKGRISQEQVEEAMGLLHPTLELEALGDCDLIIEAVYENMEVKKDLFRRLDGIARPGAILASNTSFLSIDEIARATSRPEAVLGLHFFSPANVMRLVEVIRGAKTSPDVLATGMAIARQIGKVPVVSGVCQGFIGNRMLTPRQDNADRLLLEGATPEQIDRIHTQFGMPMGPFQMMDLAGLDIGWHRDPTRADTVQEALCAFDRRGQKVKAGYYDYDDQRRPQSSKVVTETIADFRKRAGLTARPVSDEEIVVRTLYTMVNEGAKILEERIAQRASDIDVVWLYGYGWPRHKGGPMFWADQIGLDTVVDALKRHAGSLGEDFTLSPLLERCAAEKTKLERRR